MDFGLESRLWRVDFIALWCISSGVAFLCISSMGERHCRLAEQSIKAIMLAADMLVEDVFHSPRNRLGDARLNISDLTILGQSHSLS